MKIISFTATTLLLLVVTSVTSAQPAGEPTRTEPDSSLSVGEVKPTPEMWFYTQERMRHEDPKAAVRRKAEYRAAARQQRIVTRQALGQSNSRPNMYRTVFGSYLPRTLNPRVSYHWTWAVEPASPGGALRR